MVRRLLTRGLLAGLLAGVVALGVAELLGEPQVGRAIAVETRLDEQLHRTPGPSPVSRDVQSTAGLATGVLVIGTALGGVVGLAFAFASGRIGQVGPRATAALMAGAGFVAVYLVPFLKYPPNPPSVGQPGTIGHRTQLYFVLMVLSVVLMVAAFLLGHRLARPLGCWNAALVAAGSFIAATALAFALMPGHDEVPFAFPATTLWRFRMASLATQLTLWTVIGLIFGILVERDPTYRRRVLLDALR